MSFHECGRPSFVCAPWAVLAGAMTVLALMFAPLLAGEATAQTNVYQCTTPSGKIEFRQRPCNEGSEEQEITIEDQRIGWEPAKTKVEGQGEDTKKKSSASKGEEEKSAEKAKKQADKCWDKRQQLDEVNTKLRRGYSPSEGVKLHDKRRKYEEYLSHYCK